MIENIAYGLGGVIAVAGVIAAAIYVMIQIGEENLAFMWSLIKTIFAVVICIFFAIILLDAFGGWLKTLF